MLTIYVDNIPIVSSRDAVLITELMRDLQNLGLNPEIR